MNINWPAINRLRWLARPSVMIMMVTILLGAGTTVAAQKPATVKLVVDYGDGVQIHFSALGWSDGMTVFDALVAMQKHPHGVSFDYRGSGRSAMISAIGNLKNEGGGEKKKNWIFHVNGRSSDVGAGIYKLKPGDVVLWRFQTYDYNP